MILGHVVPNGIVRKIIFSFHMPLFVIVSGYFFKENEKITVLIKKIIKSLLLPYIVTLLISNILKGCIEKWSIVIIFETIFKQLIFSISFQKNINFGTQSVGPIWFIVFLVICKLIFWCICKLTKKDDYSKGLICYIITMLGVYIGKKGYWLPFSFDVALASMIFIYCGYIMKKSSILEKIIDNWKIFILLIIIWAIGIKFGNIELAVRSYPNIITTYITGIVGTVVVIIISHYIEIRTKFLSQSLRWFGRNSMYILCIHKIENSLVKYKNVSKIYKFLLKMIIVTIGTIIINHIKKILDSINKLKNKKLLNKGENI